MNRALIIMYVMVFSFPGLIAQETRKELHPSAQINELAPNFSLVDVLGKKHSLSDYTGKYVILEWVNFDCPFVRKHYDSGNMQALQKKFKEQGVVWLTICSSAPGKQGHFSGDALLKRIETEKSAATAYLVDGDGSIGRIYRARTTPHMYVINPEGLLIYMGAIDDKPSTNQADISNAANYVVAAMDAAVKKSAVNPTTTKPYGCSVKYAD